jgi:thiol-disulfide isomerase/thioredoxin
LILLILLLDSSMACAATVRVGDPAPDFHATTFDGRQISLADFKGRVLVINLWATWCVPCRAELPLLDTYYGSQKKVGLEVIAVATEDSVPPRELKKLAAVARIPFIRNLDGPYRTLHAVPTNYIIDRSGIVRFAKAQAFTLDDLNELLVPLLREQAPRTTAPLIDPAASPPSPQDSPGAGH